MRQACKLAMCALASSDVHTLCPGVLELVQHYDSAAAHPWPAYSNVLGGQPCMRGLLHTVLQAQRAAGGRDVHAPILASFHGTASLSGMKLCKLHSMAAFWHSHQLIIRPMACDACEALCAERHDARLQEVASQLTSPAALDEVLLAGDEQRHMVVCVHPACCHQGVQC